MIFEVSILILILSTAYEVNSYKDLDANVWIPSFDDRNYLSDINIGKEPLLNSALFYKNKNDFYDENNNDGNEFDSNEFENELIKYKKFISKTLKNRDYNEFDNLLDSFDSSDNEFSNSERDHESEIHSSLVGGYQFVSGGAGEGKQHLNPDGGIDNKEEIKSDIELPAYCNPPNPCPVGYRGDDCDSRPYNEFTAEFSKHYQQKQNCICDTDHNECKQPSSQNDAQVLKDLVDLKLQNKYNSVVAKKSPRMKRDLSSKNNKQTGEKSVKNPLFFHVAKKSPHL